MVPQYTPMVPTLVREPLHRPGWVYEEKIDGCSAATKGYVAKDEASAYEGEATRRWLKVKQKAWMVGGWHLVVESDDEKIRNLLLGLTGLLI